MASPLEDLLAHVESSPERLAVSGQDGDLTYRDLDNLSDSAAVAMRSCGLVPGDRVGLRLPRSSRLIVYIVAAWKAGLCYLPLDPAYPSQRTEQILEIAQPRAVVDADGIHPRATDNGVEQASETGYVIFTSGSTGSPKGVPVTETMVRAMLTSALPQFDFEPDDRWAMMHSYNFDFSVWEIWGALTTGASLHIPTQATLQSPGATIAFLQDSGITILSQVPSVFTQLALSLEDEDATLPHIRHVIFGGEDVRRANLTAWRATGSTAALTNMYGITEVTVHATSRRLDDVTEDDLQNSPIGTPLPGFQHRVVDDNLNDVTAGSIGELLLAGPQVADGYFRNQAQTEERMVSIDGTRWYRTGDLVSKVKDELNYIGRSDDQIQLRGYRIETGEIERAIARSGLVRHQAVCALERPSGLQLVAVVVPDAESDTVERLRAHLREDLPAYMVPARIVEVESLPLTPSGKLDTRELLDAGARA